MTTAGGGAAAGGPPAGGTGPAWREDPEAVHDADLVARHVSGDPHAFGELVARHRDRLWAVALRTLGDREEAADALQDALINAHRSAAGYRGDARVTTWLHRVVVNACIDRARRAAVRRTVPLPVDGDEGPGREPPDPRDLIAESDTARDVHAALAVLSAEQRAALVLVDLQGYGVEEAARILGVAPGTVKSRCSRGRARLAVALGHLGPQRRPADAPVRAGGQPETGGSGGNRIGPGAVPEGAARRPLPGTGGPDDAGGAAP